MSTVDLFLENEGQQYGNMEEAGQNTGFLFEGDRQTPGGLKKNKESKALRKKLTHRVSDQDGSFPEETFKFLRDWELFRDMVDLSECLRLFLTSCRARSQLLAHGGGHVNFNGTQSSESVKGTFCWIAFGFYIGTSFHSLSTVQDARFADCRWCCCLNRWMYLSPREGD